MHPSRPAKLHGTVSVVRKNLKISDLLFTLFWWGTKCEYWHINCDAKLLISHHGFDFLWMASSSLYLPASSECQAHGVCQHANAAGDDVDPRQSRSAKTTGRVPLHALQCSPTPTWASGISLPLAFWGRSLRPPRLVHKVTTSKLENTSTVRSPHTWLQRSEHRMCLRSFCFNYFKWITYLVLTKDL